MAQGKNFVSALLVGTASVSLIVAGTTVPAVAQAATGSYKIESQPLGQALMQLSRQANVDIVAPAKITRGRVGKAVAAESVDVALRQMLSGSGLTFKRAGSRYVIQPGNAAVQGGNVSEGASQPASAPAPASRGSSGMIAGTVIEVSSGRRLAGAVVRVAGTKISTVTDERGEYRLDGVPVGPTEVIVSFIGLGDFSESVEVDPRSTTSLDIKFGATREIVVYGTSSARALAINRERSAENSQTVISSDLLGDFQGETISDALRRAPGVAFQQDPRTGEGTNIIVRGLAPDYNQVTLNGLGLPVSDGRTRSPNLSNILADSVSEVVISKTLLPNQESSGTGGLVEIRTKSPLDRPRRFASFSAEGTQRGNNFGRDYLITGAVSGRFGASENFGVSFSTQYRVQDQTTNSYFINGVPGRYLPLDVDGVTPASPFVLDPRLTFPFSGGDDSYIIDSVTAATSQNKSKTLATTISLEWQPSDRTNIRFDYVRSDKRSDQISRNLVISGNSFLQLIPVPELGGELRNAPVMSRIDLQHSLSASLDQRDQTNSIVATISSSAGNFSFDANVGYVGGRQLTPDPVSAAFATNSDISNDLTLVAPSAFDAGLGVIPSLFAPRTDSSFPVPLLTSSGYALLTDPANFGMTSLSASSGQRGSHSNYVGKGSIRYTPTSSVIKYLEIGGHYSKSRFRSDFTRDITEYAGMFDPVLGRSPSMADLMINFQSRSVAGTPVGSPGFGFIDARSARNFLSNYQEILSQRSDVEIFETPQLINNYDRFTDETDASVYVQGRVDVGKIELIGGVRMAHTAVRSKNFYGANLIDEFFQADPEILAKYTTTQVESASQTHFLPRFLVNARIRENLIFRAGYFASVARPQLSLLSQSHNITLFLPPLFGPVGGQPLLSVTKGNPDLKPAYTHNYDASFEYYMKSVGAVKISAFYKTLTNLLESNQTQGTASLEGVILPDDPRFQPENLPDNIFISGTRPFNNPKPGHIWGVELSFDRNLDFLPGLWSGFGVYGNFTYSDSSKDRPGTFAASPVLDSDGNIIGREQVSYVIKDVRLAQQPAQSWTAGLRYNKFNVDASLFYTRQSRKFAAEKDFGLDEYNEGYGSLDARLEYRIPRSKGDFRVYISGSDLLKGKNDATSLTSVGGANGVPKIFVGGLYLGGRRITAGISANF